VRHPVRSRLGGGSEAWLRRLLRGLLLAVLALLLLLGLRDVVRPFVNVRPGGSATQSPTAAYPRQAAETFAVRFAMAYLTFDSAQPRARQQALAAYLEGGSDPNLGWDGSGRQTAAEGLPSDIVVRDEHRALVTVAVLVDGGRWEYLAVPVVADQGGLAVAGAPALVPPPGRASWQSSNDTAGDVDTTLSSQLRPSLSAFFRAYASGSQAELGYYAAPGVAFSGLGGDVQLAELSDLQVGQGGVDRRTALARVRWLDRRSGASLAQSYRLDLVQVSGKWLVGRVAPGDGGI
jgi:Conjugative transposon protein TcpC